MSSQLFSPTDKIVYCRDRNAYGGGVLIAANAEINHKLISIETSAKAVSSFQLTPNEIRTLICFYRHPSVTNVNNLVSYMNKIKTKSCKSSTFLVDDFNLPGIDWENPSLPKSWKSYSDFV